MEYRKVGIGEVEPDFPIKVVGPEKKEQAPAPVAQNPGVINTPESKGGWNARGMSYSTWNKLMADPNAKEFVTFHTEMSNGGFSFFWNQHVAENGAKYNIAKSQDFVLKFAPGHYKMFEKVTNEALAMAKSGDYSREDDTRFSREYKAFSGAMEMEIQGKWEKEKKVKRPRAKDVKELKEVKET